MTYTTIDNEERLFEINISPYFIPKAGALFVIADGLYHLGAGLGLFVSIPGAETMTALQMQMAVQAAQAAAFSWLTITWGFLLVLFGLALYRYFRKKSQEHRNG